ncbi:helix-turn-helix domain-containing protein [Mycolicibacterium austroafricanum]|uniref:helix-turn-helix domain-containing protein n=1 Tax=Mycolicibacterium austroafricanum TaxID=39687 RepID=UPI001CA32FF4|nr:helix-turn-helix domain-containing protein [Mycolicibacterium austroafricanum]QZT60937.1 hypothetical protein JN085_18205 [Mycolicibacterium austroafricanum]
MSGKKMDLGPVGQHAAANVKALRETRRLTYADLSRILDELGRPIPPLGLRRIEAGGRRIDLDDLAALALALEVSPLTVLLPTEASPVVAGGEVYSHERLRDWVIGKWPLTGDAVTFIRDSHPERWEQMMNRGDGGGGPMRVKLIAAEMRHELEGELQGSVLKSAADAGDLGEGD